MRLFDGSTSRWHVLHFAASRVLVDFRLLTPCVGSGIVGTKATGLFTLRPDFVRVGSGVYESEMSELSSSYNLSEPHRIIMHHIRTSSSSSLPARLRFPPRPPRPPRPRARPLPDPRPDEPPAGDALAPSFRVLGVPILPPLPRRPLPVIGGGVGSLSLVT